jgi:molybdenum cofactor biosynthesis enzyme MoaA
VLARLGVSNIRITGGEPFVRNGLMDFLWRLKTTEGIEELHITTNGVLTEPLVPELVRMGIGSVNLSIDTLDRERFRQITRRDELPAVQGTLDALLANKIPVKLNAVVRVRTSKTFPVWPNSPATIPLKCGLSKKCPSMAKEATTRF